MSSSSWWLWVGWAGKADPFWLALFRQLCSNIVGDHSVLYSSQQRWTWPWDPILDRACPFLHLACSGVSVLLALLKQQSFCAYLSCLGYQNGSKSLLEPYTSAQSVETSQRMVSYRDEKICLQHPCVYDTCACVEPVHVWHPCIAAPVHVWHLCMCSQESIRRQHQSHRNWNCTLSLKLYFIHLFIYFETGSPYAASWFWTRHPLDSPSQMIWLPVLMARYL